MTNEEYDQIVAEQMELLRKAKLVISIRGTDASPVVEISHKNMFRWQPKRIVGGVEFKKIMKRVQEQGR